jgi:hypothetical protein
MPSRIRWIVIPAVLLIWFITTQHSTTDSNTLAVSAEETVNVVRQASEVKVFLSKQQNKGFIQASRHTDDSKWLIQVYSIAGENGETQMIHTFNWYMVDETSAAIMCSMYEYNDGEYVGYNDDYPCDQ